MDNDKLIQLIKSDAKLGFTIAMNQGYSKKELCKLILDNYTQFMDVHLLMTFPLEDGDLSVNIILGGYFLFIHTYDNQTCDLYLFIDLYHVEYKSTTTGGKYKQSIKMIKKIINCILNE